MNLVSSFSATLTIVLYNYSSFESVYSPFSYQIPRHMHTDIYATTINREIFIQDFLVVFVIFMVFNFSFNLMHFQVSNFSFFLDSNENYMTLKFPELRYSWMQT